ncbi:MAG: bifunctional diguanylate cyclase/phosphodiesterase [Hyphomicrobium sp.]|nr:bifunctional diguanylate cyclase/phosphodiesterase [Hyphomicrobium sp.]
MMDESAYVWDIVSDQIEWEGNASGMLGVADHAAIATGAKFQALIAAEHASRRLEIVSSAARSEPQARGVPYRVQYAIRPNGPRSDQMLRLEDQGRIWLGANGKPERARGIIRVINERYLEEQRLLFRSDSDELTGQLNRIRLTEAIATVLERAERHHQPSAFLICAVNNLAVINETFGFDIGDEVIAAVGRTIKDKMRGGDIIGRFSSNKFGILIQDCGPGAIRIAAERFMKAVRDTTVKTSACQISATISVGGLIIPDQAQTVQQVLNYTLLALEKAKTKRFDCFMSYEAIPGAETSRRRNITIADEVIDAIDEHRMRLVLQAMVSAKTGKAEIYECLLRMEKPDGSLISAGEFIPIAEQLGLSRLIDRRTLELSVALLKSHPELVLSLNVSGLTCTDHEWLVTLQRVTGSRRDILSRMIIEITETAAIQDLDQSINFVDTLKELGCRVAIDDFGAGYTSFKNLKLLNVDMVKIDGAFVKNLADDTSDQIFIKTMIELAQTFGMETVAEWVGDERSVNHLVEMGITYLQGFYYGLPIDAADYGKVPAPGA